jgi:CBS domain-containing protein
MQAARVEDLMSRVVISLRDSDTISIAKLEMDIARIRHLPIVDAHNRVVGILAMSDLLRAFADTERRALRVGDVMTRTVVRVTRKTPAHEAARTMIEHKVGSLPVVDDHGELVGIVTESDFLQVAERALLGRPLTPPK